jgi:hypothetical protein
MKSTSRRRAQSLPETGLLIALVVVMMVGALGVMSGTISGLYNTVAQQITGGASPAPSGSGGPAPSGAPSTGSALLSVAQPSADQTITVSGSGFAPGSEVQAVLHPNPVTLATSHADNTGYVSITVTIPADIDLVHTHYIALVGVGPGSGSPALELDSAAVTILANPLSLSASISGGALYSGNYSLASLSLSSTVTGASGPVTYAWSDSFTDTNANPTPSLACTALPGTTSLVVTDGSGHHGRTSVNLSGCPDALLVSANASDPTFAGNYTSMSLPVSATASGGSGSLSYAWTGAHLTSSANTASATLALSCSSSPSVATVTVTDGLGQSESADVTVPACTTPIEAPISSSPLYSANYSLVTMSLSASISGGSGSPTYLWTGPGDWISTDATPAPSFACSDLASGTAAIGLTITDGTSHQGAASATLAACPSPISVSASAGTATYTGNYASQDLTLTGSASGGTAPLSYHWVGTGDFSDANATSPSLSLTCSSSATDETLTASDANGQSASHTVSVPACTAPISAPIGSSPLYSGNYSIATITFSATVTGGSGSPTYLWTGPGSWTSTDSSPAPSFNCSALISGTAQVHLTITDSASHTGSSSATIAACPSPLNANASTGTPSYTGNYASMTVNLTGSGSQGTAPLSYRWTGTGSGTFSDANIASPTYSVSFCPAAASSATLTVTDATGQSVSSITAIPACAAPINISAVSVTSPLYSGNYTLVTNTLSATATGGNGTLSYTWSGTDISTSPPTGATTSWSFTCVHLAGSVTVTVADSLSQTSASATVPTCPGSITSSLSTPAIGLNGNSLSSSASGGNPAYTYNWSTNVAGATWSTDGGSTWSGTAPTTAAAPLLRTDCSNLSGSSTVSLYVTDTSSQSTTTNTRNLATCVALTITTNTVTRPYAANNAPGVTYAGFIGGDTYAVLGGTLTYTPAIATATAAGSYSVSPGGLTSYKYAISYVAANVTITKVALTITASSNSMAAGTTPPAITASDTGFVNSETSAVLTTQPTCSTTVTSGSAAGTYTGANTCTGAAATNYTFSYVAGNMTVTAAPYTLMTATGSSNGGAAYSTNGTSWTGVSVGTTGYEVGVQNANNFWINDASHTGIYHLNWNGSAWTSTYVSFTCGGCYGFYPVAFAPGSTPGSGYGIAVGQTSGSSLVYAYTSNGGNTWSVPAQFGVSGFAGLNISQSHCTFSSATIAWCLDYTNGYILKWDASNATNLGASYGWTTMLTGVSSAGGVYAPSSNVIIVVASYGTIKRSTDGGVSWNTITSNTTKDLRGVYGSGTKVWAVGWSGTALYSTDSGATWTNTYNSSLSGYNMAGITASDSTHIYAYDTTGHIWSSTDNGVSWTMGSSLGSIFGIAVGH